jgi:ribosomal protein L37AE/L43A
MNEQKESSFTDTNSIGAETKKSYICVHCKRRRKEKFMLYLEDGKWICDNCAQHMSEMAPD